MPIQSFGTEARALAAQDMVQLQPGIPLAAPLAEQPLTPPLLQQQLHRKDHPPPPTTIATQGQHGVSIKREHDGDMLPKRRWAQVAYQANAVLATPHDIVTRNRSLAKFVGIPTMTAPAPRAMDVGLPNYLHQHSLGAGGGDDESNTKFNDGGLYMGEDEEEGDDYQCAHEYSGPGQISSSWSLPLLDRSLDLVQKSRLDHDRSHLRVRGFYAYCREAFVAVARNSHFLRARPRDVHEAISMACRITGTSLPPTKEATARWLRRYVPGGTVGQVLSFDEFVVAARQLCPRLFSFEGTAAAKAADQESKTVGTIDTTNVHSASEARGRALTPDYPGKGQKSFERTNKLATHNPSYGVLRRKANAATLYDYDAGESGQPILKDVDASSSSSSSSSSGSMAGTGYAEEEMLEGGEAASKGALFTVADPSSVVDAVKADRRRDRKARRDGGQGFQGRKGFGVATFGRSPGLAAPLEKDRVFSSTRIGEDPKVAVRLSKERRDAKVERRAVTGSISRRLGSNLVMVRRHMNMEDCEKIRIEERRQMKRLVSFRRSTNAVQHERLKGMKEKDEQLKRSERRGMMTSLAGQVERTRIGKVARSEAVRCSRRQLHWSKHASALIPVDESLLAAKENATSRREFETAKAADDKRVLAIRKERLDRFVQDKKRRAECRSPATAPLSASLRDGSEVFQLHSFVAGSGHPPSPLTLQMQGLWGEYHPETGSSMGGSLELAGGTSSESFHGDSGVGFDLLAHPGAVGTFDGVASTATGAAALGSERGGDAQVANHREDQPVDPEEQSTMVDLAGSSFGGSIAGTEGEEEEVLAFDRKFSGLSAQQPDDALSKGGVVRIPTPTHAGTAEGGQSSEVPTFTAAAPGAIAKVAASVVEPNAKTEGLSSAATFPANGPDEDERPLTTGPETAMQHEIIRQMQASIGDSGNSLLNNSNATQSLYNQEIEYGLDGPVIEPPYHMLSAARLYGRGIAEKTKPPFGSSSQKGPPPEFYVPVNVAFVPGRCM